MPTDLETTRRHLHGVAELLVAGPQHRVHGTIRLAADPGGIRGVKLPVAIEGTALVWPDGRTPLTGTVREIASIAGIEPGAPEGLYADTSGWISTSRWTSILRQPRSSSGGSTSAIGLFAPSPARRLRCCGPSISISASPSGRSTTASRRVTPTTRSRTPIWGRGRLEPARSGTRRSARAG